ncbi:MAG: hypothetical protein RL011_2074, partial [Pseudomonadota bacterium]
MTRRLHFPIAGKIIIVTLTVLLGAVLPITIKSYWTFRERFGDREVASNSSQAETKSTLIEAILRNIQDKSSTLGKLILQRYVANGNNPTSEPFLKSLDDIRFILNRGGDLISLKVYHRDGKKITLVANLVNQDLLKANNLKPSFLDTLDKLIKPPLSTALAGEVTTKNRSVVGKAGILTVGIPLAKNAAGQVTHAVLADVSLAPIQQPFRNTGERTIYLVDKSGIVLAHPQEKLALKHANFSKIPVVKQALSSPMAQGQLRYQVKDSDQFNISAFSRTSYGLSVISEASEAVILEPAKLMQIEAGGITGVVISIAFFFIFLFSLTLTRPIEKLVQLTKVVATGNFDVDTGKIAKARDEVGTLATAFGAMLHG